MKSYVLFNPKAGNKDTFDSSINKLKNFLSDKEIDVYSFYGTKDTVLNVKKYEKYRENLPEDTIEEVIDGGNHSYYAHYGEQEGDGEAIISRKEQQECVIDVFLNYE